MKLRCYLALGAVVILGGIELRASSRSLQGGQPDARTKAISLKVNQAVCFEPCSLTVKVSIEPHPANYKLVLVLDGGEYYGSEWALTGDSPKTMLIRYPRLSAGNYEIAAALIRHDGGDFLAGRDTARVQVVSSR
jgi:hypothetical protein